METDEDDLESVRVLHVAVDQPPSGIQESSELSKLQSAMNLPPLVSCLLAKEYHQPLLTSILHTIKQ